MDLNQINLFISVVEAGSLSGAARSLGIAKSNISRALTALEKSMGQQLVYRNTRHFHPTALGTQFYQQCVSPLLAIKNATNNTIKDSSIMSGKIILTTSVDIAHTVLPLIISDFIKTYPMIKFELRAEDRVVDLVKEGVDLALRVGNLKDSTLKQSKISEISLVLVAQSEYISKYTKIKDKNQLADHTIIVFNKKFEKKIVLKNKFEKKIDFKINNSFLVSNPLIAKSFVLLGHGVALLPEIICNNEIKNGQLVRVLPELASSPEQLQFVWPAHVNESQKIKTFIDFAKIKLKSQLIG